MEKPKFHLNPNEEIVKTIREGLKRTGGYCPCRLQHIPENICICKEFKEQLADPVPLRAVCEGLRFFPFYNNYNKQNEVSATESRYLVLLMLHTRRHCILGQDNMLSLIHI